MIHPSRGRFIQGAALGLTLLILMACNMVSTPASPATAAPTPIVQLASATPKPASTVPPLPTTAPPTQRPPAATAVLPATVPPPQPNPNLCYFYPYGVNGLTITLYTGPGEINPLGATISANDFITAMAQSGAWLQVRSAAGQVGWVRAERGNLGGNCAALPQLPAPQECRATASVDTTVYVLPDITSQPFGMTLIASASVAVIARSNGFLGFDPGVNWVPPNVTGLERLRWLPPGDSLTLTGACDSLPVVTFPEAECRATANVDTTVYTLPDDQSKPFGFDLIASASVRIIARSRNGYYGFDPGISQIPPSIVGNDRLRWLAPDNRITLTGACDKLPVDG